MSTGSRNFYSIDVGRSRTTSGPASDLAERILLRLDETPSSGEALATAVGGDPTEIRELVRTMINLKLIEGSTETNLALSSSGRVALETKLLSISSGDSV
jgi:predicted transcriptional regulator